MFLVLYEHKPMNGVRQIRCEQSTFATWEDADVQAKETAVKRRGRTWIFQVEEPPLLEIPTVAESKKILDFAARPKA